MTDVVIVNPGSLTAVYQGLGEEFSAIETPAFAAYTATFLRNHGMTVALVDAAALQLSPTQAAELILSQYSPLLVLVMVYGFQPSASTQNMPAAGTICAKLKERSPTTWVMMTGTHPAALPERTLREEAVDFVCSGEGPVTALQTLLRLKYGGKLSEVPSLWYREEGRIVNTPAGELLQDLDREMPEAAYDLLPMDRYRAHNWHCFERLNARKPYASIYTSLGCPYKCSFCCINAPFGGASYRLWSPERVVGQIDRLVSEYGVRNLKIVDEMFVLNRRHVEGVCRLLIRRRYDLNIWAYARIDTVRDTALIGLLRDAGFRWLALGIESGSAHVRDGVEKGRFGYEQILEVVRRIQAAGINVIGNYIFGLPDDTLVTMNETLDLALEANCEFANFYSAMAYPGSRLYSLATQTQWPLPASWLAYSQHSYETQPLGTEHLTPAEVLRFRDAAFRKYFSGARYREMIKRKFGQDSIDHLDRMLAVPLPRRLYSEGGTTLKSVGA